MVCRLIDLWKSSFEIFPALKGLNWLFNNKKQPPEFFFKKRCSKKFLKFYRKTLVWKSLFNKVADLQKFAKFLRTPILKKICQRLLLHYEKNHCFVDVKILQWCFVATDFLVPRDTWSTALLLLPINLALIFQILLQCWMCREYLCPFRNSP